MGCDISSHTILAYHVLYYDVLEFTNWAVWTCNCIVADETVEEKNLFPNKRILFARNDTTTRLFFQIARKFVYCEHNFRQVLGSQGMFIEVRPPVKICGDIHGQVIAQSLCLIKQFHCSTRICFGFSTAEASRPSPTTCFWATMSTEASRV